MDRITSADKLHFMHFKCGHKRELRECEKVFVLYCTGMRDYCSINENMVNVFNERRERSYIKE